MTEQKTDIEYRDWDEYQRAYRDWQVDATSLCNQMIGAQQYRDEHDDGPEGAASAWNTYAPRLAEWGACQPLYAPEGCNS